jgi:hypothetical protein
MRKGGRTCRIWTNFFLAENFSASGAFVIYRRPSSIIVEEACLRIANASEELAGGTLPTMNT